MSSTPANALLTIRTIHWGAGDDQWYQTEEIEEGPVAEKGIFVLSSPEMDYVFQVTACRPTEVDIRSISSLDPWSGYQIYVRQPRYIPLKLGETLTVKVGDSFKLVTQSFDAGMAWWVGVKALVECE